MALRVFFLGGFFFIFFYFFFNLLFYEVIPMLVNNLWITVWTVSWNIKAFC